MISTANMASTIPNTTSSALYNPEKTDSVEDLSNSKGGLESSSQQQQLNAKQLKSFPLKLPKYILLSLFKDWLTIMQIGLLDSALCNSKLRPIFFSRVCTKNIMFTGLEIHENSNSFPIWASLRQINVECIKVYDHNDAVSNAFHIPNLKKMSLVCTTHPHEALHWPLTPECTQVTELCVSHYTFCGEHCLWKIMKNCESLTILKLENLAASNSIIDQTLMQCSTLQTLMLNSVRFKDTDEQGLTHDLETRGLDSQQKHNHLRQISVTGCTFSDLYASVLCSLIQRCPNLTAIDLFRSENITDNVLLCISKSCTLLKEITLGYNYNLTDVSFEQITLNCTNLQSIQFRDKMEFSYHTLNNIGTNCSNLTNLKVCTLIPCGFRLINESLSNITTHCALLQSLHISNKNLILASQSLVELSNQNPSHLTELVLTVSDIWDYYKSLIAVAEKCANLTRLGLSGGMAVLNDTVVAIGTYCTQLVDLSIHGNRLNAKTVAVLSNCIRLETLSIHDCNSLTDACVIPIVTKCTKLKELRLDSCIAITDETAVALATCGTTYLTALNLGFCPLITDAAIALLTEKCWRLVKLDIVLK